MQVTSCLAHIFWSARTRACLLTRLSLLAARRRTMGKIISQRSRAKLTRTRGSFPAGLESWHFPVRGFMDAQPSPRPSTASDVGDVANLWPRASAAVGWLGPTRGVVKPAPLRPEPRAAPDFAVGDDVELLWHTDRQWCASPIFILKKEKGTVDQC